MSEQARGAVLESLIVKVRAAAPPGQRGPQIVAMTATASNLSAVADWLGAVLESIMGKDARPGISSNSSVSLKSNSFSMILEPLILASRVLDGLKENIIGGIRSESTRVEGILKILFPS